MTVQALGPRTSEAWFEFFDSRAFADHADWDGCYCTAFHNPKPAEYPGPGRKRRDYARWLIDTGRMAGYLAFVDGRVVGWVNANDRSAFPRLAGLHDPSEKVLSVVCFLVEKDHRGRGVATRLLARVLEDARAKGYLAVEAYPKTKAGSEFGAWNGPYAMYERAGFVGHRTGDVATMRKYL